MPTKSKKIPSEWFLLGTDTALYFVLQSALEAGVRVPRVARVAIWVSYASGFYVEYEGDYVVGTLDRLSKLLSCLGRDYFFPGVYAMHSEASRNYAHQEPPVGIGGR